MSEEEVVVFWFRRDLRLEDNIGLQRALSTGPPVLPVFILDTDILSDLHDDDPRVTFIYDQLQAVNTELAMYQSSLLIEHADPRTAWKRILDQHHIAAVYANEDYEPYGRQRDITIEKLLAASGIPFNLFKDQVVFAKDEVAKPNGQPYTVYTPYKKRWLARFQDQDFAIGEDVQGEYVKGLRDLPTLGSLGFNRSSVSVPPIDLSYSTLSSYESLRNDPSSSTTNLSTHLRFGTMSVRMAAAAAIERSISLLNELIWREFFMQILWHFPEVVNESFKPKYDYIEWRNNEEEFDKWCNGQTGFPLVDAGMRQLNETGLMHNRVRMVCASFLVKNLLIDWRWGEAYFARKLLDFELSSNNGNWQWVAGTGCDAAPYFRIFNPIEQQRKFDPGFNYIKRWVPEYGSDRYPQPMIDYSASRVRALETYKASAQVPL